MAEVRKIFNYDDLSQTKTTKMTDRKNLYANTISAAGCLFYEDTADGHKQLLLIKYADPKWPRLDDLGGKIDEQDATIYDAIIREALEETNHVISDTEMRQLVTNQKNKHFYNKQSKYYLILVKVDNHFYPDTKVFGQQEEHDQILRTISWYKFDDVKGQLAYRLLYISQLMTELGCKTNRCLL
jgi:8-oxo-dGTP pyrophosphatase MutT (NUDIX family)